MVCFAVNVSMNVALSEKVSVKARPTA